MVISLITNEITQSYLNFETNSRRQAINLYHKLQKHAEKKNYSKKYNRVYTIVIGIKFMHFTLES